MGNTSRGTGARRNTKIMPWPKHNPPRRKMVLFDGGPWSAFTVSISPLGFPSQPLGFVWDLPVRRQIAEKMQNISVFRKCQNLCTQRLLVSEIITRRWNGAGWKISLDLSQPISCELQTQFSVLQAAMPKFFNCVGIRCGLTHGDAPSRSIFSGWKTTRLVQGGWC